MKPGPKLVYAVAALAGAAATLALTALLPLAGAEQVAAGLPSETYAWGLAAAATATALSSLGAGYAVAKVGAAAVGALAEKPELFARLLILVGLAEGIAIYGLIVSVLILNRFA